MASAVPIATVLVLPDRQPLGPRLIAALAPDPQRLAETRLQALATLDQQMERLGQAVVFSGSPQEAQRIAGQLRAAGLTTSLNLRTTPVTIAAGEG